MLDRSLVMDREAIGARSSGARRAAMFLETLAADNRADALLLIRGFPAANDGPDQGGGEDPPFGPDEPTPGMPPRAA
jgi:hypothetical protein